jgi:hypothetical protein
MRLVLVIIILLIPFINFSQTTVAFTSTTTWTCPYGVTTVTVKCWGGGGSGGGTSTNTQYGGGGGAGGAYAQKDVTVVPGTTYTVTVGATKTGTTAAGSQGNPTWFSTVGTVYAEGGQGGAAPANSNVSGGTGSSAASIGTIVYAGGDGAGGSTALAGAGGGGAGSTGNGGNASTTTAGVGTANNGGNGGAGILVAAGALAGNAGVTYGGGGSGAMVSSNANLSGGNGAAGYLTLTYTGIPTTFTIGASADDFTSITAARTAIESAGVAAPIILEIQSDYAEASETYPITFASVTGASSTNTITYRPATGVSNLVSDYLAGSSTTMINFNGADYIILDGRAGGVGTTLSDIQWTIRNTRTAATVGSTIELYSDATYNQFNFLNIEGECGIVATTGIVNINSGSVTGNDYNQFNYCKVQDLTTGGTTAFPFGGICMNGTSAAISDDYITIDNCHIINISTPTSTSTNYIVGFDVSNLTITNNHMYHNSGTSLPTSVATYFFSFIFVDNGTGHTITGNYMGGTSSSCGGSSLTFTGASNIRGVQLQSLVAGSSTSISNNTFSNFSITSTMNVSAGNAYLVAYRLFGASDITCSNNLIGSMTSNGNITITHNNASALGGILAIWDGSSASTTISNNNIGGITINSGTSTLTLNALIHIFSGSATGSLSITGNTLGGASGVGGQISIADDIYMRGIYSERTTATSITNNTIQNISHSGNASLITIFNNVGPFTCTGNTIKDISTGASNNGIHYLIAHGGNVVTNKIDPGIGTLGNSPTISSNSISNITCSSTSSSSQFNAIYINASGTITCSSNTLGSTTVNNMSFASDNQQSGIYIAGNGSMTVNSNTIQQWNITNTGTSTSFSGIWDADGALASCNLNSIKDITIAGASTSSCIGQNNTDASSITNNTIQSITTSNSTSTSILYAIYVNTSASITCSTNTIGSSTNNNMTLNGNSTNAGIYFAGTSSGITCSSNTIQEFNLTNTGSTTIFYGIYAASGLLNATSNIITNIDNTGVGASSTIISGIFCATSSASNAITSNTISNLNATTTSANSPYVRGISLQTGGGSVKKNMVKDLTNAATSSPFIYGIIATSGSWGIHNNVILLSNGSIDNNISLNGIQDGSVGTMTIYHNTIKISGTSSFSAITRSFRRTAAGTTTVKNNIFQNTRTGSGTHYAYSASDITTITSDYNYLEATNDANSVGFWNATAHSFTNWKTAFSGEDNSLNGTNTLSSIGKAPTNFTGANLGVDLFTGSTVIEDKEGTARDVAPWMGAYEAGVTLPITLVNFGGYFDNFYNKIIWETASEINNDFFSIERSDDGESFQLIKTVKGNGNSTHLIYYQIEDYDYRIGINYYRLRQTDFDGKEVVTSPISIDNRKVDKEIINIINLNGQSVNNDYTGIIFIMYSDGTILKSIKMN